MACVAFSCAVYRCYLKHVEKCIDSYVMVKFTYEGFSINTRSSIPRVVKHHARIWDAREPANADTKSKILPPTLFLPFGSFV